VFFWQISQKETGYDNSLICGDKLNELFQAASSLAISTDTKKQLSLQMAHCEIENFFRTFYTDSFAQLSLLGCEKTNHIYIIVAKKL